jgi:hypothetical protein
VAQTRQPERRAKARCEAGDGVAWLIRPITWPEAHTAGESLSLRQRRCEVVADYYEPRFAPKYDSADG